MKDFRVCNEHEICSNIDTYYFNLMDKATRELKADLAAKEERIKELESQLAALQQGKE